MAQRGTAMDEFEVLRVSALEDNDFSRWMENLPNEKQLCPLKDLAIPGSHDSGTFFLDQNMEIGPDESSTIQTLGSIFWQNSEVCGPLLGFHYQSSRYPGFAIRWEDDHIVNKWGCDSPQRYPYVNPRDHCKAIPCICRGVQFYPSQPQDSVKHPLCLSSLYKKVVTRSRLYQFGRNSGLWRSRLGDHLMRMTWAKEQRERLMSAKPYLKSDYKVRRYWIRCSGKPVILIYRLLF